MLHAKINKLHYLHVMIPSHIGIQGNEMVDQQAKNIAFIRTNVF